MHMLITTLSAETLGQVTEILLLRFGLIALIVIVGGAMLIAGVALLGRKGRADDISRAAEQVVREMIRRRQ